MTRQKWSLQLNPVLLHSSSYSFINLTEGSAAGKLNIGEPALPEMTGHQRQQGILGDGVLNVLSGQCLKMVIYPTFLKWTISLIFIL